MIIEEENGNENVVPCGLAGGETKVSVTASLGGAVHRGAVLQYRNNAGLDLADLVVEAGAELTALP